MTIAIAVPALAAAQALPTLTAPVNDFAAVIDAASARDLDARIRALERASGDAVVVATVKTFAPYGSIEEYAVALFEHAGIGKKNKDNGLLIVVATGEHKVRIEVGYGLEGFVTDGFAGETIRQVMLPEFRNNRYGPGLLAGATLVIQRIAKGRHVALEGVPAPAEEPPLSTTAWVLGIIVFIVIGAVVLGGIVFVVFLIAKATGGPRRPHSGVRLGGTSWSGWSGGGGSFGGGGGSSFGGFGGGMSGGGGASGSW
jgi:uncharacterized protein